MSKMDYYPEWQNKPFWLNNDEIKNPVEVLQQFYETYSLPVCRNHLWDLVMGFMNSEMADDLNRNERSDLLYFYQGLGELVEAAYLSLSCKK